jgi:hypothetical protein
VQCSRDMTDLYLWKMKLSDDVWTNLRLSSSALQPIGLGVAIQ